MFSKEFLEKVIDSIRLIDVTEVERMVDILAEIRPMGRLFIIGSGGGAGHASHAVCDFRKLGNFDALSFDNMSEMTARANDEGFDTTIINWLKASRFNRKDCIFVISVGGGRDGVSQNIVNAINFARGMNAKIVGIIGRDGGVTRELADASILIQTKDLVTPITEGIQAILWHCLISNPKLQINKTKW